MPLINTSLPNLIQGVSQQPDSSRYDGQCEEQENALSSVVDGLRKRPNTRHVVQLLTEAISNNSFIHFINRSDIEKYVVIHDGSKLRAFNILTGNEATINGSTGGYSVSSTYLDVTNPRNILKALTVADNTFILNTNKLTQKSNAFTPELEKEAIVFVKQGDYEKEYEIDFSTGEAVQISFSILRYHIVNSFWRFKDAPTITTSTLLTGQYRYVISHDQTATIVKAGSGYEPNKTFSDNYILTFNDIYHSPTSVYAGGFDVKVETNADGEVTAAIVQAMTGGDTNIYTVAASQHFYEDGGSGIQFEAPAASSSVFGNLGKIVFKSGDNQDGLNADTRQIAFGLGFDARETSGGARTPETTSNIIDSTRLAQPEVNGSVIRYKRADGADFKITTVDGLANDGLGVAYKEVSSITDLPSRNFNGFKVKVAGDQELAQDDYYVQFSTDDGGAFGSGSYVEVNAFNTRYKLDNSTLPHRLINDGEDSFLFEPISYNERKAGDNISNPFPSFTERTISNLFFYKNRLGFLSEGNVILSEAGEFFNFFRTTTQSLLDSAPIDISVASSRVTNFKDAEGFQENLILFSENSQFVLKGGDLLTPKTVAITPVTNFDVDSKVSPLALGSYLYFPFNRGSFTGMREYTVNSTTDNYDSVDITEHVPNYIPSNINDLSGTTTEDILALTSADEPSSLFVYKYFWSGAKKLLSSWSKFTFKGEIRGIEFIEDTLYMVIVLNNQTHLVSLPFESGTTDDIGFLTHLDMRVSRTVTSGSDAISLPYSVSAADNLQVWTKDGAFLQSSSHLNSVQLAQPVEADTEVWVGIPYTMKYTFSEQLFKAASGQGKSPSNIAKLMLRNVNIFFNDTAAFDVKVTPKFRDTFISSFTPTVVGSSTIGTLTLDSGAFRVPIFTKAKDTVITIESDSALPCAFQSVEFESFIHSRSNRYN